ncbi:MAG: hypothetical protein FKY71_13860 [Spiribacter salinus]|uniref:Uncharacterized protein n=1 Tax=Spiribacter salinus TaxID=1335746 RepID=A0A540VNZ1_9GAMM|nr:MAG: hypothetical protein FKY71_13860 [Spiribacter salinus]
MRKEIKELMGLGLSRDAAERAVAKANLSHDQQAARDERRAAEAAQAKGLSGKAAEAFRTRYVASLQAGRQALRSHVQAVMSSPAAAGRPEAARDVALTPGLSTREAIDRLSRMPVEDPDTAAKSILEA